jgi:HSP20 family protein
MVKLPDIRRDWDRPVASFDAWRPLLRQLDDFMSDAWSSTPAFGESRGIVPSVDCDETDDHYVLSFDMPGLDKDNIDIEVQGNQLMVSGERKYERDEERGRSRFVERRYGSFQRAITLPVGVNASEVEAQYHNGVLTVAVPKPAEAKRQKIRIAEGKGGFLSRLLGGGSRKEKEPIEVKSSERAMTEGAVAH